MPLWLSWLCITTGSLAEVNLMYSLDMFESLRSLGEKRSELKCRVEEGVRSTGEDDEGNGEDVIGEGTGGFLDSFGFHMSSEGE